MTNTAVGRISPTSLLNHGHQKVSSIKNGTENSTILYQPTPAPLEIRSNRTSTMPSNFPDPAHTTPTNKPSSEVPSFAPTNLETTLPTPIGKLGETWWYLTSAKCWLSGIGRTKSNSDLVDAAVDYTFKLILTDSFDDDIMLKSIEISFSIMTEKSPLRSRFQMLDHGTNPTPEYKLTSLGSDDEYTHDNGARDTSKVLYIEVYAWSASSKVAEEMSDALVRAQHEPLWITEPMHEKGIHGITDVTIRDIIVSTTQRVPPGDPIPLSPDRIVYIILGTVLFFAVSASIISRVLKHFRDHPNYGEYIGDRCKATMRWFAPAVCMCRELLSALYCDLNTRSPSQRGFNLAAQDDDDTAEAADRTGEEGLAMMRQTHTSSVDSDSEHADERLLRIDCSGMIANGVDMRASDRHDDENSTSEAPLLKDSCSSSSSSSSSSSNNNIISNISSCSSSPYHSPLSVKTDMEVMEDIYNSKSARSPAHGGVSMIDRLAAAAGISTESSP